jgi:bacterioferritin-associated ferredoxin
MDFSQPHTHDQQSAHADSHRVVCHCLNVSESEIRDAIAEHEPQSIRGVAQVCGAGGGCMSCHRHIRRLLNERVLYRRSQIVGDAHSAEACSSQVQCGS